MTNFKGTLEGDLAVFGEVDYGRCGWIQRENCIHHFDCVRLAEGIVAVVLGAGECNLYRTSL